MAALIKLRQMPLIQRCAWAHLNKVSRGISTSKKNSDVAAAAESESVDTEKNWVSYGFDYKNKTDDTNAHHASFFFSVSLCLVVGGFCWAYAPDIHMRDWAQREAFLELHRREKANLHVISPDYVDPKTINLPSEDELADVEIII